MERQKQYSVKQLARLAGVSVRTLHLYDQLGLLKPAIRTEARYRLYGEAELLRLQQILFYKELEIPLQEIGEILDDPEFDLLQALKAHRQALQDKGKKITAMLDTIDKTIQHLKGGTMLEPEELYAGLPKETAEAWRKEAKEKYGDDAVERSENALRKMSKPELEALVASQQENRNQLINLMHEDPTSEKVQQFIARHYAIIRKFWGTEHLADKQAEAYKGLGQLYVNDERFTLVNGKPSPEYAAFMAKAMAHYADHSLK
jgi:DNA-binding transcriptional MerR regulator